jgi:hypothetical protein
VKRLLFLGAFLAAALGLFAADWGFTLHQNLELSGQGGDDLELAYTPGLGPWFSSSSRETLDLYLSGFLNMTYGYDKLTGEKDLRLIPELGRCSLFLRPAGGFHMELGRIPYGDPNSLIVSGLLDGFSGVLDIGNSRLSLGTFYTGLLYRETAKIFMTAADSSWDHGESFSLAGRRLIAALDWELPSLFESPHSLVLNALVQFDLNRAPETLHSQYLSFQFVFSPLPSLYARAGAVLGLAEYTVKDPADSDGDRGMNMALNMGLDWKVPGSPADALSFGLAWGSGGIDDSVLGYFPSITLFSSSSILSTGMAGLAALRGTYTVRLRENLSLGMDGRYFLRGNLGSFDTLPLAADRGKKALGGEIYGSAVWVPVSDISLAGGAGLFFPALGNVIDRDTPPRWKTRLTLTFSL